MESFSGLVVKIQKKSGFFFFFSHSDLIVYEISQLLPFKRVPKMKCFQKALVAFFARESQHLANRGL